MGLGCSSMVELATEVMWVPEFNTQHCTKKYVCIHIQYLYTKIPKNIVHLKMINSIIKFLLKCTHTQSWGNGSVGKVLAIQAWGPDWSPGLTLKSQGWWWTIYQHWGRRKAEKSEDCCKHQVPGESMPQTKLCTNSTLETTINIVL